MSTRLKAGLILPGLLLLSCGMAQASSTSDADTPVASSKVGIDPTTGKLRPLTAEESAALERASTPTQQKSTLKSNALRGAIPADEAAARATERRLPNGGTARKVPVTQMNSLTATRDASGKLVIAHSEPGEAAARHEELPSE